jgi:uncharacterized protein (TIGR03083 family)
MRLELLADAWDRWARRCAQLTTEEWTTPTRCDPWDVRALVAHACPDPQMFDTLAGAVADEPPAVTGGAALLRFFNQPGGAAHTMADQVSDAAVAEANQLTPDTVVDRFARSARRVRELAAPGDTVVRYPVVGTATLAAIVEVAVMEATVHLLDLADAVGGVEPSAEALAATRDLLVAVPDPMAVVEVLAGRIPPQAAVPAIR